MKNTHRRLFLVLLTLYGLFTCQVVAIGQEVEGEGRRFPRRSRPAQVPTFNDPQPGQNQFAAQPQPDAGTGEPRDMIAVTVWDLTISDSTGPESDELVGKLIDKANNLPTVLGTADEVRDLVSRLKAANLMRKSREFRLLATDGQLSSTQSGADRPSVIATQVTSLDSGASRPRRGVNPPTQNPLPAPTPNESPAPERIVNNSIQYRSISTLVQATPRIDTSGGIQILLNYSASDIERSSDVVLTEIPGRDPVTADSVVVRQIQSSVRLKSGTAVVVQADAAQTSDGESLTGKTHLLILAASVQPALE